MVSSCRSPIRHRGDKKLVELSYIYVFKELVIFMLFFKSTAAAWTSAIPVAVSFFFCLFCTSGVLWVASLPAQNLLPLECWCFLSAYFYVEKVKVF